MVQIPWQVRISVLAAQTSSLRELDCRVYKRNYPRAVCSSEVGNKSSGQSLTCRSRACRKPTTYHWRWNFREAIPGSTIWFPI
ncbi:hypothetical protein M408DRAFT_150238 [Serendipita vermifera MAFF 305830]|uniref:Uncharacterized protein n=1 Tax=Serendipita vermifera MAFF 305830 TaxID=933852 RepID=A0A0C2X4Z7_SERVB|nr:hypothetical protein M408DRAFT_150238 [Serendipita vermifera MAFF 305830]